MREVPEHLTMHPGDLENYNPARYRLRVYDAANPEYHLFYYQMSTPFPRYEVGDKIRTLSLPLEQEGRLAEVEKILHNFWCIDSQVYFGQDIYCRFHHPTPHAPAILGEQE